MKNSSDAKSMSHPDLNTAVGQLKGRALSSVEFLKDYLQLRFDGPCLTAYTSPTIEDSAGSLSSANPRFREVLCALIGEKVIDAWATDIAVFLRFYSDAIVSVSVRDEDYNGPEALQFTGEDGAIWVA